MHITPRQQKQFSGFFLFNFFLCFSNFLIHRTNGKKRSLSILGDARPKYYTWWQVQKRNIAIHHPARYTGLLIVTRFKGKSRKQGNKSKGYSDTKTNAACMQMSRDYRKTNSNMGIRQRIAPTPSNAIVCSFLTYHYSSSRSLMS